MQIGTKANGHLGKRGIPSALCSFPPKVCKWALRQMGTWGKCTFGGKVQPKYPKEVPQVSYAHFSQMFTSGHRGKWALGVNAHLEKRGIPCPKEVPQVPYAHLPQMFTNGHWGKWALGENVHLGQRGTPRALKGYPKCPMPIYPKCM